MDDLKDLEKTYSDMLMNIMLEASGEFPDEHYMINRARVLLLGYSCKDCKYYGVSMNGSDGCANKESKYAGELENASIHVCSKYKHFLSK
jgi:hypothetical protein